MIANKWLFAKLMRVMAVYSILFGVIIGYSMMTPLVLVRSTNRIRSACISIGAMLLLLLAYEWSMPSEMNIRIDLLLLPLALVPWLLAVATALLFHSNQESLIHETFLLVFMLLVGSCFAAENALFVIQPYWKNGTWVFDAPERKLDAEPFVLGIDQMISELVADIPQARKGFSLIFSSSPFPKHEVQLKRGRAESGGYWYTRSADGKEGWLCPALFKYYPQAPEFIYAQANPLRE